MGKRVFRVGIGVAVVLMLVSCSSNGNDSSTSGTESHEQCPNTGYSGVSVPAITGEVTKDQSKWTLPTDPYLGGVELTKLDRYANDLVMVDCMNNAGYSDYSGRLDFGAPGPENLAGDGITVIFTEQFASQYGYRVAPDQSDRNEGQLQPAAESQPQQSPEYLDQLQSCRGRALDEMMTKNERTLMEKWAEEDQAGQTEPTGQDSDVLDTVGSQLNQLQLDYASNSELVSAAANCVNAWRHWELLTFRRSRGR